MPVMSLWEKQSISRLVRDAIVQVCKGQQVYGGLVDIDAIVCISGQCEGQEVVVKIHERLGSPQGSLALTDFLTRPREGWSSATACQEDNAEDYSLKRPRLDDSIKQPPRLDHALLKGAPQDADSYPNLKQHLMNPSHHIRDVHGAQDIMQNAKELSSLSGDTAPSPAAEDRPYSPQSPGGTNLSRPHSPWDSTIQFPFTSTPHSIYPRRRIPVRNDRWSPNQAIPNLAECKPCRYTFSNFEVLSDHNEAVHSVFTCQSCFKTFTSRSNLERHSRLHTGHRPYSCTICGKTFSRKDHLSNHATKHAYKCGTCSKRFTDKKLLVTHYSYDHNAVLTNICELCNKGFSSAEQYEDHLKVHPQCMSGKDDEDDCVPQNLSTMSSSPVQAGYTCKTCSFQTADRLTLIKHQIIHQDNARCYTCLACAKLYDDPLHYSDHLLVHNDETNIFECCICRQICPTLTSLRRHEATHINMAVDDERDDMDRNNTLPTFACSRCDKTFQSTFNLDEHMELHQKTDSGFACTVCHQEFEDYGDICSHIEEEGHYVYPGGGRPYNGHQPSGSDTADIAKNKRRKQKVPKSVKNLEEMSQESDIEIVEPEAPDDDEESSSGHIINGGSAAYITHTNNGEFLVTENLAPIIEIVPDDAAEGPESQPIKRLLSQAIQARVKQDGPADSERLQRSSLKAPLTKRTKNRSPDKVATATSSGATNLEANNNNNNILLSPKLMNVEIPEGPFTCSICSCILPSFQELEMHCFSEHNRSPCMFCSKTFAQKANRDRHVCLHTGDKPYSCPNCNEKFSRGDKLKIHRMRAHQTAFPSVPSKSAKESSPCDSPSAGHEATSDDWSSSTPLGGAIDALYSSDWSMRRDVPNEYVAVTGEWSVKEVDDSGIEQGNDLTIEEAK